MRIPKIVELQHKFEAPRQGERDRDVQLTATTDEGQEVRTKDCELARKTPWPWNESTTRTRTDCTREKPSTIEILQRDNDALFGDPDVQVTPSARLRWATVKPVCGTKRERRKDDTEQEQNAPRTIVCRGSEDVIYVPLPGHGI